MRAAGNVHSLMPSAYHRDGNVDSGDQKKAPRQRDASSNRVKSQMCTEQLQAWGGGRPGSWGCNVGTAPMGLAPKGLTDAYSNSLESSKFRKLPQDIEEAGKETSQIKYDESRNNLDCSTWVEHPWHPER